MTSAWTRGVAATVAVLVIGSVGAVAAAKSKKADWSYEGKTGPEHWGDLDPAFEACKIGKLQSPIDIPTASAKAAPLDPIRFEYKKSPLKIIDNRHTIQVVHEAGSRIRIGADAYELVNVNFHRPGEWKVDGKSFPLSAHLVHKNAKGKVAVVAVLFLEGKANGTLATVFSHVPKEKGKRVPIEGVNFDASTLLPAALGYFTFTGSVTSPPCTEGVRWFVLKSPSTASADEIAAFAKHYPRNARPVQPVGGREIKATR